VSAAATRDDLASVVTALTESAAMQRRWQTEYKEKATQCDGDSLLHGLWLRFAAEARGTALAFEISADMISKYVGVEP